MIKLCMIYNIVPKIKSILHINSFINPLRCLSVIDCDTSIMV